MTNISSFVKIFVFLFFVASLGQTSEISSFEEVSYLRIQMNRFYLEQNFIQATEIGAKILKSSEYCHDDDRKRMINLYKRLDHHLEAFKISYDIVRKSSNIIHQDYIIFLRLFDRGFFLMDQKMKKEIFDDVKKICKYLLKSSLTSNVDTTLIHIVSEKNHGERLARLREKFVPRSEINFSNYDIDF
ncbi:MAG: hypothetical protein ACRYGR_04105 [Janthinobacterium lividum]